MNPNKQIVEALFRVKNKIRDPRHWVRGQRKTIIKYAVGDTPTEYAYCLLGAFDAVYADTKAPVAVPGGEAREFLNDYLRSRHSSGIVAFNDSEARNHGHVLAELDCAIAAAREVEC